MVSPPQHSRRPDGANRPIRAFDQSNDNMIEGDEILHPTEVGSNVVLVSGASYLGFNTPDGTSTL
jgi:hypothetical protein